MHIVFDARIHLNHITGISRYILNLLKELLLIDTHNQYTILINGELKEDDILLSIVSQHRNVKVKRIKLPHFGPVNYTKLPKIIKSLKPDIYHYPHLDAPIAKGITTIATVHDANFNGKIKKYNDKTGIKTFYFNFALKNTLNKAKQIIFVSNAMLEEATVKQPKHIKDKCKVIHNGLESNFNQVAEEIISDTKRKYNLPPYYFLFVGQLREHKNIGRIIEAFSQMNHPTYKLVIAGFNYPNNKLNLTHPGIQYLGMVSDDELKALYKLSACFLFPSLLEGFGLPILEALSFGTPVITSNFGATKEISGNVCKLVDPYAVDAIRKAMEEVVLPSQSNNELTQESLISAKMEHVKQFTWKEAALKTLALYKANFKEPQ